MQRLKILLLFLIVGGVSSVQAQQLKRWNIGLAYEYGISQVDRYHYYARPDHRGEIKGHSIVSYVRYKISPKWSLGLSFNIPFYPKGDDKEWEDCISPGVEFSVRRDFSLSSRLQFSLSAVGFVGNVGPLESKRWNLRSHLDTAPYPGWVPPAGYNPY